MVKAKMKILGMPLTNVLVVLAIVGLVFWGWNSGIFKQTAGVDTGDGKIEVVSGVCSGTSSVNALYNDFNAYKAGTDPASTLTIYQANGKDYKKAVSDDASSTTVPTTSSFKAVAGTNAGSPSSGYFSELVEFSTVCDEKDIQPALKPATAPTLTIVNDDGITKNSDTNSEVMGASGTFLPTLLVKSGSESCASRHGAYVIADYDNTYFSTLSSSDLADGNTIVLLAHNDATTNITGGDHVATNDQFKVWLYDGELCDGDKKEAQIKVVSTSTQPIEDTNIDFYWFARDIDTDADTYQPLSPAVYDEDNNVIGEILTNVTYYVQ